MANDAQVLEIRNNLFQMLDFVSTLGGQHTPQPNSKPVPEAQRIVVDRLCMCIALISLNTVNTCWMNSIEEIITFGSENTLKCYLALLILKFICEEANN